MPRSKHETKKAWKKHEKNMKRKNMKKTRKKHETKKTWKKHEPSVCETSFCSVRCVRIWRSHQTSAAMMRWSNYWACCSSLPHLACCPETCAVRWPNASSLQWCRMHTQSSYRMANSSMPGLSSSMGMRFAFSWMVRLGKQAFYF